MQVVSDFTTFGGFGGKGGLSYKATITANYYINCYIIVCLGISLTCLFGVIGFWPEKNSI